MRPPQRIDESILGFPRQPGFAAAVAADGVLMLRRSEQPLAQSLLFATLAVIGALCLGLVTWVVQQGPPTLASGPLPEAPEVTAQSVLPAHAPSLSRRVAVRSASAATGSRPTRSEGSEPVPSPPAEPRLTGSSDVRTLTPASEPDRSTPKPQPSPKPPDGTPAPPTQPSDPAPASQPAASPPPVAPPTAIASKGNGRGNAYGRTAHPPSSASTSPSGASALPSSASTPPAEPAALPAATPGKGNAYGHYK